MKNFDAIAFDLDGTLVDSAGGIAHALNAALAEFARTAPNVYVVDVRPFINQPADVTDNLRHYQPRHYRTLAQHLAQAIGTWQGRQLPRSAWADWRARAWSLVPAKVRNLVGK